MVTFLRMHAIYIFQLAIGFTLVYAAIFLHEDEEGVLQNRVEEWWLRVMYRRHTVQEKISSFSREVAHLTARIFDRLFGRRLFSLRVIGSSLLLTPASGLLLLIITALFHFHNQKNALGGLLHWFMFLCVLAFAPAISDQKVVRVVWWICILWLPISMTSFILFVIERQGFSYVGHGFVYIALVFALSLGCDILYLAITRRMLSQLSQDLSTRRTLYFLVGHLLLLLVLLGAPIFIGIHLMKFSPKLAVAVMSTFAFNTLNLILSSLGFIVGLFLLMHHAIWPLIERPLYALQRFSPVKNYRKQMLILGSTLILIPAKSVLSIMRLMATKI